MYARLARFEGADPQALEQELQQMGEQIRSQTTPSEMSQEEAETLRAVKRVLVLADREKGSTAMIAFCDTEEDIRRIDEMFNQMSPGDQGGKRQSVDLYEVAIDEQTGS
jgi:lipopolysaccharide biosynthesis protein